MSRRGWWLVWVVFASGCLAPQQDDGGIDASTIEASPDAGADAGSTDSGLDAGRADASLDSVALSFSADDQRIHLSWDAGALAPSGWIVLRDDQALTTLAASAREFDDVTAPAGGLSGFDASATRAVPDGIEIEWNIPSAQPGPSMTYRVRAMADASVVLESNEVSAMRSAPTLLGFTVERGDGGWSFAPVETVFLDTSASSPSVSVTGLQAQAQPNDQTSSVVLRATATVARLPVTLSYTVRAEASAGAEPEVTVSGDRGGNRIEYQWQRSLDDSPDAFVDLPYVHGTLWLDPEAVLGEGRYYRVVARAQTRKWLSAPVRAELRRPLFLSGDHDVRYILRDDGLALELRGASPPIMFPPVSDFVVAAGLPCGLLLDGGVVCRSGNLLTPLSLPPATRLKGGPLLCASTIDAGAQCVNPGVDPGPVFDLTDMDEVLDLNRGLLCGRRPDGGVHCVPSQTSSVLPFDVSPVPLAIWVDATLATVTVSYPNGQTQGTGRPPPPAEDAGYVSGSSALGLNCGLRSDHRVRCTTVAGGYIFPSFGTEQYSNFDVGEESWCALSIDHRVRCYQSGTPFVPPRPPARDVAVAHVASFTLLESGQLDFRGYQNSAPMQLGLDDQFVQISRRWFRPPSALRADGSALALHLDARQPPPADRYRRVASGYGLRLDGGIAGWDTTGWLPTGAFMDLQESGQGLCAQRQDGGWECEFGTVPPVPLSKVALGYFGSCGLTPRGRLICWPTPAPPALDSYRFRHVSWVHHPCATTLEGEVYCFDTGGAGNGALPWDDFLSFEESLLGCGIRRDHTVGCRLGVGYAPPW